MTKPRKFLAKDLPKKEKPAKSEKQVASARKYYEDKAEKKRLAEIEKAAKVQLAEDRCNLIIGESIQEFQKRLLAYHENANYNARRAARLAGTYTSKDITDAVGYDDEGDEPEASNAVSHPSHYGGDVPYEVIKVIEAWEQMFPSMNFNRSTAIKYIPRAGEKSKEKEIEDLEKSIWYLQREVRRLKEKL